MDLICCALRGGVLVAGLALASASSAAEIKWTEEVGLRDGKTVRLERRTELGGGGFPASKRGFHTYHEMCYAPLGAYWKSKPEYRPEVFELDGGRAYVRVTLRSWNACTVHDYPESDALYFRWSGAGWEEIDAGQFPGGARFNLLQDPIGKSAGQDARGLVRQEEKESRDAGLYYSLRHLGKSGLNEIPPYKGVCREFPVDRTVAPRARESIFLSGRKGCN